MPTNDAINYNDATTNCALCSVAGLLGSTYDAVLRHIGIGLDDHMGHADLVFARYYRRERGLNGIDGSRTLEDQILGICRYLGKHHEKHCAVMGSRTAPLTLNTAHALIQNSPVGSEFLYAIGSRLLNGTHIDAAHWLVARRTAAGARYWDYQTDLPPRFAEERGMSRQAPQVPLNAPSVTAGAMEAFGRPAQASDGAIVIPVADRAWQRAR
jgi:hypothetical protein